MRKISIKKWKATDNTGKEVEENTLIMLNALLLNKKPDELPKGLDKFRLFNRIGKAFDIAEKTNELILEEADYLFLKGAIEKDIPSVWGLNKNILKAIDEFLNAKEE